jgi:hypothetical protein
MLSVVLLNVVALVKARAFIFHTLSKRWYHDTHYSDTQQNYIQLKVLICDIQLK